MSDPTPEVSIDIQSRWRPPWQFAVFRLVTFTVIAVAVRLALPLPLIPQVLILWGAFGLTYELVKWEVNKIAQLVTRYSCEELEPFVMRKVTEHFSNGEKLYLEAIQALRDFDEFFDGLWACIPWGKTVGVDFAKLNMVPLRAKDVLRRYDEFDQITGYSATEDE